MQIKVRWRGREGERERMGGSEGERGRAWSTDIKGWKGKYST